MRGTMIYFNEEKDVGFIRTDDGERLQVLRSGFVPGNAPVGRCKGLPVQFHVEEGDERAAIEVMLVEEDAPRRARRRPGRR